MTNNAIGLLWLAEIGFKIMEAIEWAKVPHGDPNAENPNISISHVAGEHAESTFVDDPHALEGTVEK